MGTTNLPGAAALGRRNRRGVGGGLLQLHSGWPRALSMGHERRDFVLKLHRVKREKLKELVAGGEIPLRAGTIAGSAGDPSTLKTLKYTRRNENATCRRD